MKTLKEVTVNPSQLDPEDQFFLGAVNEDKVIQQHGTDEE